MPLLLIQKLRILSSESSTSCIWRALNAEKQRRFHGARQLVLLTLFACSCFLHLWPSAWGESTSDAAACPCKVCPCYCPCIDRNAFRVGFLKYDDDWQLRIDDAGSRRSFALASGVRQAARDRGLLLNHYASREAADLQQFETDLLQDSLLHAVVVAGGSTRNLSSLVAAVQRGIPVYLIGNAPRYLVGQIRAQALGDHPVNGQVTATPLAGLVHIGSIMEDVGAAAVELLLSAGIERLHCINTHENGAAYQETCRLLVRSFAARGLAGASHMTFSLYMPLALTLEGIATMLAAQGPWAAGNGTVLVVMDTAAYALVQSAREAQGLLPQAHILVIETSVQALADIRAGKAVTVLDQPYYSQAYMAVALAAQELVTGQRLTTDVLTPARFLSVGEVTDADMAREVCREEGFPVCGDPGVPNVTARGCACFPRSDVKFHVLASLPRAVELRREVVAGLLDAQRDFAGSSFTWLMGQDVDFSYGRFPLTVANAAIAQNNWTALLSLDYMLAPNDPALTDAMVRLGQLKGNRSYWLGSNRNESMPTEAFLAQFAADGYIGASPGGWASLGRVARDRLGGLAGTSMLMYQPLIYLPVFVQMPHMFVVGFFNDSLVVPPDFWRTPVQGDRVAGTGVWSLFCDGWTAPELLPGKNVSQGSTQQDDQCSIFSDTTLQIKLSPPALSGMPFVNDLTKLLHIFANATRGSYDAVTIGPFYTEDVPLALKVLEDTNATTRTGAKTALFSMLCFSSDLEAFSYPGSLPGGDRHAGCIDPQSQLSTYIAYMAAVLHQQTMGERLLPLDVSTERVLTRDRFTTRAQQRAADCRIARRGGPDVETMFPVCDYHAGCGGNETSPPCSGHGVCQFPTAEMNAAPGGGLPPSVGWCVCHKGHKGLFCEAKERVPRLLKIFLPIALALSMLLALLLPVAVFKWVREPGVLRAKGRWGGGGKRRPPAEGQLIAVVFTDVEGSTELWEWNPEVMVQALQVHYRLLRALLPKHHGYESNTEGDAFELVFHNASDALHWAMDAQLALLHPEKVLGHGGFWAHLAHSSASSAWPPELLTHPLGAEVADKDGAVLYRGLRVRMGIHTGLPDSSYQHPNGRQRYLGKVVTLAKAIGDAPDQGGQVLMSLDAWGSLHLALEPMPLVAHSMGEHVLGKDLPPLGLMQVLPQSLQGRVPFRPLRSREQFSPSFFEAPASESYLAGGAPRDPVAIMFTFVCGSLALQSCSTYPAAVRLLTDFVRATLHACHGYECEEKDGNFLLAFANPLDAAQFSQELQVGAMALPWPNALLLEEDAAEVVSLPMREARRLSEKTRGLAPEAREVDPVRDVRSDAQLVYRGLRIKCGICWGKPVRCLPHGSTGRAAYFGPIMNRAARIASTASDGETLCNAELVQAARAVEGAEEVDVRFMSLGAFSLKGIVNTMELFQVSTSLLAGRHFAPRTPTKRRYAPPASTGLARRMSFDSSLMSPTRMQRLLSRLSFDSTSNSSEDFSTADFSTCRPGDQATPDSSIKIAPEPVQESTFAPVVVMGKEVSWVEYQPPGLARQETVLLRPSLQTEPGKEPQSPALRRSQSQLGFDSLVSLLENPIRRFTRGGGGDIEQGNNVPLRRKSKDKAPRPGHFIPDDLSRDGWVYLNSAMAHSKGRSRDESSSDESWSSQP